MDAPRVVVIVLNWNLVDDTQRCVESLRRSDYANFEIVVVDNGSDRAVVDRLRSTLAGTTLLCSEINLGFAEGNNLGFRYALDRGADYVLVINNDTVIDPAMLRQLVEAAEAQPKAGLLGPIIYYFQQPDRVWFAGYRFSHGIYVLRRGLRLKPPIQPLEEVDFVSGCGVLIRSAMLEQVGFFSNEYFMYYEDVDLCFRVKAAGYKIVCVTGAKMWHAVSASSGGADSPIKQYYQVKSSLIFYRKYFRGPKRWLNIGLRFVHAGFTVISAVLRGRLQWAAVKMFLKGTREGWQPPSSESGRVATPQAAPTIEHLTADR